jgi:hypothetical protein
VLDEASSGLNCKIRTFPFTYLGLPIGGDSHRIRFWHPLAGNIKSILSEPKSINLYMGGRLDLLKSVMYTLPVYFLSFFKASACIISSIEYIFNCFMWGQVRILGK